MFQISAAANPIGVPSFGNPAKSPEEMNMDKLCVKTSKDVIDINTRRVKTRKETASKGRDLKDVSEDAKDEFNFVLQTLVDNMHTKYSHVDKVDYLSLCNVHDSFSKCMIRQQSPRD
ncbi:hypothetical protein F5146DRAFT_1001822 [Armillaria mellea]|nr:hypothetical protein F5146DRAFT_1001816 [Armillaria mellea]KAK0189571.1 hypothetical protein F5146DRAFT_1001822 [Armillaria mellea]